MVAGRFADNVSTPSAVEMTERCIPCRFLVDLVHIARVFNVLDVLQGRIPSAGHRKERVARGGYNYHKGPAERVREREERNRQLAGRMGHCFQEDNRLA
jgi:hypothetical protein